MQKIKVMNDVVEWGTKLIEQFDQKIAKDE